MAHGDEPVDPVHRAGAAARPDGLAWTILESLPGVSYVMFDAGLRITAAGGENLRAYGYSAALIVGRSLRDVIPASAYARYLPHYEGALAGRVSRIEAAAADGRAVYVSEFSPTHDGSTGPGGVVVSWDVTARRQADERHAWAGTGFARTFEHTPIGTALVGLDGLCIDVNPALCHMVDREAAALVGRPLADITHPDDRADEAELAAALRTAERTSHATEQRCVRPDGTFVWVLLARALVRDPRGQPTHLLVQLVDVTRRRASEAELREAAYLDPLTGLLNRRAFDAALAAAIAATRRRGARHALGFVDLDGFKAVNDRYGHGTGDAVLRAVAAALARRTRAVDSVGRRGGDEFVVLLDSVTATQAGAVFDELQEAIRAIVVRTAADPVRIDASIGFVMLGGDRLTDPGMALAAADGAMYAVKQGRRR